MKYRPVILAELSCFNYWTTGGHGFRMTEEQRAIKTGSVKFCRFGDVAGGKRPQRQLSKSL